MSTPTNNLIEYRLIFHRLTSPKCFIDYLHNYQYSFVWQTDNTSDATHSVSTKEYAFDSKNSLIDFQRTKLKLRLNSDSDINHYNDQQDIYTTTKLILREHAMNRNDECVTTLDEITLSTNYFIVNKKQETNITFNKIVANGIRIELRLNVTLIAKTIKFSFAGSDHCSLRLGCYSDSQLSQKEEEDQQQNKEVLKKWKQNMAHIRNDSVSSFGSDYHSDSTRSHSHSNRRSRRSALCANSVQTFYKKSKQIEEKNKEETKQIEQQMKSDYTEMGNQLQINLEEVKNLKTQMEVLQSVLIEKNKEIDRLKLEQKEMSETMAELQTNNAKYKRYEQQYKQQWNENKIAMQTMKYELQYRLCKYNKVLEVMREKKKQSLKAYIAQLIVENDDLENEITRISESWRSTSHLMENFSKKKSKKLVKLKGLYHEQLKENQVLKNKLMKVQKNRKYKQLHGEQRHFVDGENEDNESREEKEGNGEEMLIVSGDESVLWNNVDDDGNDEDDEEDDDNNSDVLSSSI